jgi:hypothetical protein
MALKGKILAASVALASALPTVAFASDTGGGGAAGMGGITGATSTVVDMAGVCWDFMSTNPFLCVALAGSLISGVGIRTFKRARRAAGG